MTLPDLSAEKMSDLIGLVYDSAFEEVQWRSFLREISELFPGVGAIAWGYDGDYMFPEYANGSTSQIFPDYTEMDVRTRSNETPAEVSKSTPNGFVSRTKIHFDEAEWRNSITYRKYLKPAGYLHSLHLKVDHNGDRGAYLAFALPDNKEMEEKIHDPLFNLLKLLSPHAVRACQLARALTLAKRATEIFGGFLDGILIPMIVTDEKGHYLFANAAGRRLLDRKDPLHLTSSGDLVLGRDQDTRALRKRLLSLSDDIAVNGLKVETEDGAPLLLALTPFRPSMREASQMDRHLLEDEQLCAVFVGQADGDEISHYLLEDVFDLTPREAEVCGQLMLGASAGEIAENAGRSPKTVRNQIQVIYEKVGVTSNVALMDALSIFRTVGGMFNGEAATGELTETAMG